MSEPKPWPAWVVGFVLRSVCAGTRGRKCVCAADQCPRTAGSTVMANIQSQVNQCKVHKKKPCPRICSLWCVLLGHRHGGHTGKHPASCTTSTSDPLSVLLILVKIFSIVPPNHLTRAAWSSHSWHHLTQARRHYSTQPFGPRQTICPRAAY